MLTLGQTATVPAIQVPVQIEGKEVIMELDTGASVSLMPIQKWRSLGISRALDSANCTLRTYTGEKVPVCGRVEVEVQYQQQKKIFPLLIVEDSGPALLGGNWLTGIILDWHNIRSIQAVQGHLKLQDILDQHKAVFSPGLGTMDIQASIYLKPGTVPKFWKHRHVPYALREAVEEELHRLEREEVLEKLDTSEWGTPVVCVRKKDGSIRLCGDYKVTLNQCMHINQYPLPRPEDLFY